MLLSIIAGVLGANLRKNDLSCEHHISIGLKSGDEGNKQITLAPTLSISGTIEVSL